MFRPNRITIEEFDVTKLEVTMALQMITTVLTLVWWFYRNNTTA